MKKSLLTYPILFFSFLVGLSQEPNDLADATAICGNIDFAFTPTGPGVDDFASNSNPTCLPGDPVESQSIWLRLTIDTGGTLEFSLIPNNGTDDYDWAMFNITTAAPNTTGTQLRCSSTMFLPPVGETGLGNGATDFAEGPGTGDGFLAPLNVNAGDVLLLFINNWSSSTSGFDLSFGGTATFNPPPTNEVPIGISIDLEECDTDGVVDDSTNFDLTVNTPIIIGSQTGVTVTYHTSEGEAQIGSNAIPNPTNFANTSNPQTIYARITNDTTECFSVVDFEISVTSSLTMITTNIDIELCDDNNDGLWDFDLTQNDVAIIDSQPNMQVTYYETETDANSDSNPIVGLYQNTSNPQMIWARLENISGCFGVLSFSIQIYDTPIATAPPTMSLCDDDNNGTMPFDLTSQDSFINFDVGMTITYHPTQADADTNTNAIASPFESSNATIFARVENDLNAGCYDTTSFDIEVYDSAFPLAAVSITNLFDCDNISVGSDTDGFIIFDLTQQETTILNGQSATDFTLTYFTDAGYTSQITTPTDFTNTISGGQTGFVRMTNNLNPTCFDDTSFDIEVFELPILNAGPYVLEQCDDDFDGFNIFNLTEVNTDIATNIISEVFTYYESSTDATNATNAIPDPINYINQLANIDDTVWVRIENDNGCFRVVQIELVVKPSAIPTIFLREFFECDGGADTTDGIAAFDFSSVTAEIEAIFPVAIDVFYYENEADATSEINEISDPSNFMNTTSPGMQEIWVRADSALGNDCLGNGHHITLTVHSLPQFEVDREAIVCLNLPPITLETFNPSGIYSYEWTDPNGTIISTDPTALASFGGDYSVVANYVTSSGTSCQSEPRIITVSESVIASFTIDDVTITDDSDNNTITINSMNLGIGDYEFALDEEFGIYQDEPFFDMVAPGLHTIYIRDKNDCGIASLEVSVIGFPKFFTPNNDGENDYWRVKGVTTDYFSTSLITIYDRFGKAIAEVDPTGNGWDGFYNGTQLPATDYWFTAQLIDQEGNTRDRKGHFSLIRR